MVRLTNGWLTDGQINGQLTESRLTDVRVDRW